MVKINIDYHYENRVSFNDSVDTEDDNGFYFKTAEESKLCYRYTFNDIDEFLDFFGNDFEKSINDLNDNFIAVVITVEK